MSRFNSRLRFSLEELAEELENDSPDAGAGEDTIVDVAADDAGADDNAEVVDAGADDGAEVVDAGGDDAGAEEVVEDDVPAVVSADDVVVDTTDSVENDLAEADEAEAAVDENVDQAEELEEAAEGLESIRDLMIAAQQRGGLSPQAARMAKIAVESYGKRIGIESNIMPSMESFGGNSTRLRATNLSIESIGDWIKKAWEAIKAFIIKIRDAVVNWFGKLFNSAENLRKRALKLQALRLSGTPKSAKIKSKGLAKKIAVGTKADMNPETGLDKTIEIAEGISEFSEAMAVATDFMSQTLIKAANGSDTDTLSGLGGILKKVIDNNKTSVAEVVLPGNMQVKQVVHDFPKIGKKFVYFKLVRTDDYDKVSDEAEIPTMKPDQIRKIGSEIADKVYKTVSKARDEVKKNAARAKALKSITAPKEMDSKVRQEFADFQTAIRLTATTGGQALSMVCSQLIRSSFAYVQLAERSAAQYGAGGGQVSKEAFSLDLDLSLEDLSARTRAILKQFGFGADGANVYMGHKAESLAKKIAKLEAEIEEAKALKATKVISSNESDEVSMEGIRGAAKGYKEGAKAFWTKDGKLSWPSFKRYHDWLEKMQIDIDEKSARVKELKAELKALKSNK